jgi:hypothetical protein
MQVSNEKIKYIKEFFQFKSNKTLIERGSPPPVVSILGSVSSSSLSYWSMYHLSWEWGSIRAYCDILSGNLRRVLSGVGHLDQIAALDCQIWTDLRRWTAVTASIHLQHPSSLLIPLHLSSKSLIHTH